MTNRHIVVTKIWYYYLAIIIIRRNNILKSTITDLWRGNIAPVEHCGSHDAEANHLLTLMEQNREKLCKGLTAAQAEVFEKYMDCSGEYLLRMSELSFCEGFCLGSKLATEALL